jgi:hypothetical protein
MVQQAEVLKDDADAPPEIRALTRRILGDISSEKIDEAARWPERHEQHAQKRRLSRAGRSGEEVKRAGMQVKIYVAQDFLASPVTETDILESNKSMTGIHNLNPAVRSRGDL